MTKTRSPWFLPEIPRERQSGPPSNSRGGRSNKNISASYSAPSAQQQEEQLAPSAQQQEQLGKLFGHRKFHRKLSPTPEDWDYLDSETTQPSWCELHEVLAAEWRRAAAVSSSREEDVELVEEGGGQPRQEDPSPSPTTIPADIFPPFVLECLQEITLLRKIFDEGLTLAVAAREQALLEELGGESRGPWSRVLDISIHSPALFEGGTSAVSERGTVVPRSETAEDVPGDEDTENFRGASGPSMDSPSRPLVENFFDQSSEEAVMAGEDEARPVGSTIVGPDQREGGRRGRGRSASAESVDPLGSEAGDHLLGPSAARGPSSHVGSLSIETQSANGVDDGDDVHSVPFWIDAYYRVFVLQNEVLQKLKARQDPFYVVSSASPSGSSDEGEEKPDHFLTLILKYVASMMQRCATEGPIDAALEEASDKNSRGAFATSPWVMNEKLYGYKRSSSRIENSKKVAENQCVEAVLSDLPGGVGNVLWQEDFVVGEDDNPKPADEDVVSVRFTDQTEELVAAQSQVSQKIAKILHDIEQHRQSDYNKIGATANNPPVAVGLAISYALTDAYPPIHDDFFSAAADLSAAESRVVAAIWSHGTGLITTPQKSFFLSDIHTHARRSSCSHTRTRIRCMREKKENGRNVMNFCAGKVGVCSWRGPP